MERCAQWLVRNRKIVLAAIGIATLGFLVEVSRLSMKTDLNDLYPQKHPFIKVHNMIRNIFGGANQILIMVQVRKGDIFNPTTLEKVQWISREVEKIPGVDPYKIRSIASSKMKDFKFTSGTLSITPLMFPNIPRTDKEMQELKDKIYSNLRYYGQYVSYDSKKTLIMVDFFEEQLDYRAIFNALSAIRQRTEDDNHIINIAGEPMHLGYIYHHSLQVLMVLLVTVFGIIVMLYIYYRNFRAVLLPILSAAISAVWGLGFMSLMKFNLDPLVLVLPFLISLMTARHSMQLISRYLEEFERTGDSKKAAAITIEHMLLPGLTSIITDALGIALVGIAAIPILVNIAIACGFWSVATVVLSVLFTPLSLACLPVTARMQRYMAAQRTITKEDYRDRFLSLIGRWIPQRGKWYVLCLTIVVVAIGWIYAQRIQVGDFMPGSSILWPFHRYNKDAFRITFSMPLLNPLYVIVEGDEGGFITKGSTLREMDHFQRYLATHDRVMFTYSIVNNLPGFLMSSNEDDPQWCHLPKEDRILSFICRRLLYAGEPGTWDRYVDMQDKYANIVVYCRDKMPKTVESIIQHIQAYLSKTPGPPGGRYLLAGGAVGVQAAVREVIADAQIWNLLLALGSIFLFCALNFRSCMVGIILTIPLAISNIITFALMGAYHIGLTVNTYPISSVGIGLGVDYGIYFMSRLIEEKDKGSTLESAIHSTLRTNGKSIVQIATTLTIGLLLWVFSALKFQAEMGLLLAILLFLNMLGALFLVPTLVCILKPKRIMRSS
ncbi:MAG: MMPL family transporter [Desulfobacterota bacterium]|nr:MMPL family transporter [Thermodesulfobacteriota bacterium]